MGMMKDRIIEAQDRLGVDELPEGWYVDAQAVLCFEKSEAEKRIVTSSERVEYIV